MQPNRLERHWRYIERKLQEHYPRVPFDSWPKTEGQHDKIVDLIRDTYARGRAAITIEAEVRDLLNRWVTEVEGLDA